MYARMHVRAMLQRKQSACPIQDHRHPESRLQHVDVIALSLSALDGPAEPSGTATKGGSATLTKGRGSRIEDEAQQTEVVREP